MLKETNTGDGYYYNREELFAYQLVAYPEAAVKKEVMIEKEYFSETYQHKVSEKAAPYITVAYFLAKEAMESTMIRYMHRILSRQKSFPVLLNNYSGFPPHTVYMRVQDHQPFKQLADSLKIVDQYAQSNGCPPANPLSYPHVTIAKRLRQNVYDKAIFEYARKTFHAHFEVEELILLRKQNPSEEGKRVNVFKLQKD